MLHSPIVWWVGHRLAESGHRLDTLPYSIIPGSRNGPKATRHASARPVRSPTDRPTRSPFLCCCILQNAFPCTKVLHSRASETTALTDSRHISTRPNTDQLESARRSSTIAHRCYRHNSPPQLSTNKSSQSATQRATHAPEKTARSTETRPWKKTTMTKHGMKPNPNTP